MQLAKSVEEYIEEHSERSNELVKLRNILLRTELTETVKWGMPHYLYKTRLVVGLASFKNYSGLWFHHGVFLADAKGVLQNAQEEKTRGMRQWRFVSMDDINEELVYAYVLESIENAKAGKEIKPQKKALTIPEELDQALRSDSPLKLAYNSLSRGKQIEYADFIGTAKQDATRINRLRKSIPMIMNGAGLNDKYK
jgi:uncharacterized protein YdeI (YjbR/CyaY-like superfamily)